MLGLIDMEMDLQQKRYPTYNKKQQHFPPLTSDRRYVKQQRNFHLTTYQYNVHIRYKMREILIRVLRQSKQESLFHDGLSNHLSQNCSHGYQCVAGWFWGWLIEKPCCYEFRWQWWFTFTSTSSKANSKHSILQLHKK